MTRKFENPWYGNFKTSNVCDASHKFLDKYLTLIIIFIADSKSDLVALYIEIL